MPRGKKKASSSAAPPADPPPAKKRRTAAAASGKASASTSSTKVSTSKRTSGRGAKKAKDLNVWDQERCEEWFDGYNSEDPDVIDPSGYQKFLEDLDVDITGTMPFIISWKLGATKTFHITREEWIHGMKELKVDTLDKMKAALPSLEKYASSSCAEETFLEIYHWTFNYLKENEMRKVVDVETAIPVLQVLFADRENRHIHPFLEFLKEAKEKGSVKCLNKDQWDVFYEFSRSMDDVFTGYDDTAAWPSLFDEYVEWRRGKEAVEE